MENQFETISSAQRNVRAVLIAWLAMALLALLGLKVSIVTWVFFEGMVAISCLAGLFLTAKGKWRMRFEGTLLTITNTANHSQYYLNDLKKSDFIFSQSSAQKKKNCAHLKIVGSSAVFNDVQNFEELKAYLDQNFS